MARLSDRRCPRCADFCGSGDICARCLKAPPHFDAAVAAFAYTPPISDLILSFKYTHHLYLGQWMGEQIAEAASEFPADIIVPLPLHPKKLAERGFNQAVEIARPIARQRKMTLSTDLVERTRITTTQTGLSFDARQRNMANAFTCKQPVTGLRVLVVDDVITSGASVNELAKTLKQQGASAVFAAAIARTQQR